MKYQHVSYDVCHLCRDALIDGKISTRYTKNERRWVLEVLDRSRDESWRRTGADPQSCHCEVCGADEADLMLFNVECDMPIVEDDTPEWTG